jgi:hypothetical protein
MKKIHPNTAAYEVMLPSGQTRVVRSRILDVSSDGQSDLRENGLSARLLKYIRFAGANHRGWLKMAIVEYALCQAHRNNITRYERLLKTYLTDIERDFIEVRLSEAKDALSLLDQGQRLRGDHRPTSENMAAP